MEKFFAKVEAKFDAEMTKFEKSPVKTGLKWMLIIWVLRTVWGWTKDETGKLNA